MQEHFRHQYSKFGNTREQYFHVWRSFQFDEATDTIDGYIYKVKQVAALLDYGEPQILELFKNTLPGRLYYLLYQIDNLNAAIEMAKRILTKEKIDKQKTDQSSATPFMKASQDKSKKNEMGVSFSALETMDAIAKHSDNTDKLTSLVNKLVMKIDRREAQYRPAVYQNRNRGHRQRQNNNYRYRNRSYNRDRSQSYNRGRGNFQYNRNYRPNYRGRSRSRNGYGYGMATEGMTDMTVDQIMEETILDKTVETKGTEIEAQVKTAVGLGQDIDAILEITIGTSPTTQTKVEIEIDLAVEMKDKGPAQNPR